MSTDLEWEQWGRQDPYFGVITDDRYRAGRLDAKARAEFFASGQSHVDGVLHNCRAHFDPGFTPRRVLDFGCGVGRLLIPFAALAEQVVGVDVSPSMLAEARKNCDERGLGNVLLQPSDDGLSQVQGAFDLVHSAIVLQHVEIPRGRQIFRSLLERLAPGGMGALQLTYAKARFPESFGQPPPAPAPPVVSTPAGLGRLLRQGAKGLQNLAGSADPEMLMNSYNLNELFYLMQTSGIASFHTEFTDHGGEFGVFLYFRRPPGP